MLHGEAQYRFKEYIERNWGLGCGSKFYSCDVRNENCARDSPEISPSKVEEIGAVSHQIPSNLRTVSSFVSETNMAVLQKHDRIINLKE